MPDKRQSKQGRYQKLQAGYFAELPNKIAHIQSIWQAIRQPSADTDALLFELRRQIHSLAGSAGSFGFSHLGKRSLQMEIFLNTLSQTEILDDGTQKAVNGYLEQLQILTDQGPEVLHETKPAKAASRVAHKLRRHLVYIVEDDVLLARKTAIQLQHYSYDAVIFATINAARSAISQRMPSILVIDVDFPEGYLAGPKMAEQFAALRDDSIPVIFTSARNDWPARLAAVRAGGDAYLVKPFDFISLIDRIDRLLNIKEQQPYRILIVEDQHILAKHYASVLRAEGMLTHILTEPSNILATLQEFKPELVLMDIYMPDVSGMEIAKVIRQTDAYLNVPIVYLSTESGLAQQLAALRLGGDDFLQKPIQDEHLASAVRFRVSRFRDLSALMVRDSLTGLLNHITLKLELEGAIAQSVRNNSPLSFVMLDIDHFKNINDQYGHPAGDRVIKSLARLLQQRLRSSDSIGRYGGEEFAVILPDTGPQMARDVLEQLREDFAMTRHIHDEFDFTATFSAGIAAVPDYRDMNRLITAADNALYEAKRAGRNGICIHAGP